MAVVVFAIVVVFAVAIVRVAQNCEESKRRFCILISLSLALCAVPMALTV